ncbi:hypothetical protein BST81_18090 [Leptolyngbya sp. 'hensonii']|uniref:DUF1517 domain-containing protein n=1 Tax=Leptolyngbya sp. 'hensonii' TaxID=1922337 RepID=UPI00094FF642|nr:DUF1517 domain-containing protein [Leptolyngbya sp. 'hensonii']OLP16906.1 hypothetical protein BST81_18090 [Leptolyngbya sp. 'hensonii']
MTKTRLQLFSTALATLLAVSTVDLPLSAPLLGNQLDLNTEAVARSSGGRSRSGSFKRSTPPRSNSGSSSNQNRNNSNSRPNSQSNPNYRPAPGPVVVPVPIGQPNYNSNYNNNYRSSSTTSSSQSSTGDVILGLIILLIIGGVSIFILWWVISMITKASRGSAVGAAGGVRNRELENDTVTVTKLQVALLASARDVQTRLNEIGLSIDTDTPEGMAELLQESALALLRTPENWSHVAVSSQTVRSREQAEALFNQLSVTERSKFSAETLVNVGGKVRRQSPVAPAEDEMAAYLVVTLLIGTEYDKPLVGPIHSTQELQAALEKIAALPADSLSVFELLWSPQDESDSLTYDELLTEYTEMVQIA